ncbi:MAG: aldehyde dehydrogenase family protein [Clostridiales Family XIII bacterium]|jgi:sulfoacetaldehyde dehydrogenase|nr:aldehyde dehydrogenase family protein [Clostridiales Family XIII bacterium]
MLLSNEEYIDGLITKAKAAQRIAEGFSQERVDELTEAVAYALTIPEAAEHFAKLLVSESGMGVWEHKQAKIYSKVKGSYAQMKSERTVGLIDSNKETGIDTYARPMGVIGAVMPVTNGEATPMVKSLMAIKTRNAIILSPHPKAAKVNMAVTDAVRAVLKKFDAPEDLIQPVAPEYVSIETSQILMKKVDFILATGSTPMVRQAYSSGIPAIGVGTGNVVCIIDETADLQAAAEMIVRSKSFDNATSCSTENNIIVMEEIYDSWAAEMERAGAVLVREGSSAKSKLLKALWPESPANHRLNRAVVAKSAKEVSCVAGIEIPDGAKLILVEENGGYGNEFPFTGEKLAPVAGVRKAKNFDDAIEKLLNILDYMGKGHSVSIHTKRGERVQKMGEVVPVCKIVVNQPQSLTNSGSWTCGFPTSMTLGCGTWGHNSISHNATFRDLLNFVYVSREIPSWQPKDEELFSEKIRSVFK